MALAWIAGRRGIVDPETVPEALTEALVDAGLVSRGKDSAMRSRLLLTEKGGAVVLKWRESMAASLRDQGAWIHRHYIAGEIRIDASLDVVVEKVGFESAEVPTTTLDRWREIRADIFGRLCSTD